MGIAAALLHPFDQVVGIEALQSLHQIAETARIRYFACLEQDIGGKATNIKFIHGDFVESFEKLVKPLIAEISVCLACSTCFGRHQMAALESVALLMNEGSFMITVTQSIADSCMLEEGGAWQKVHSEYLP